jgi:hypothetical protein
MLNLLTHIYNNAELYTILLVLIVVPLGYWECLRFFQIHFGMFGKVSKDRP